MRLGLKELSHVIDTLSWSLKSLGASAFIRAIFRVNDKVWVHVCRGRLNMD